MTDTELNKFENILTSRRAELEQIVRNRDGIAIEKTADVLDEIQHATERELATQSRTRIAPVAKCAVGSSSYSRRFFRNLCALRRANQFKAISCGPMGSILYPVPAPGGLQWSRG